MAPSGYGLKSSFCSVGKEVIFGEYFILQNIFQIQITDRTKKTLLDSFSFWDNFLIPIGNTDKENMVTY